MFVSEEKKKFRHNNNAYNDLHFDDQIFDSLDHTITYFGKQKLKHRLAYCMTNSISLNQMVAKNYTIHLDTEYRSQMKKNLMEIKLLEQGIIEWMNNKCEKKLLFSWNIFNNRLMLTTSNTMKYMSLFLVFFVYLFIYIYLAWKGFIGSPKDFLKQMFDGFRNTGEMFASLVVSNYDWIESIGLILAIIYSGYMAYSGYQSFNTCREHYNNCNTFYDQYNEIIKFVQIVDKMISFDTYSQNSESDNVVENINNLKKCFTESSSIGYSLVVKLDTLNYRDNMNTLVNFVGKIDCQLCVCELIDSGYVIPEFISNTYPVLHVDNIWSPILHTKNIEQTKNSIAMNTMTPNIMIITGPNAAGKSTFMKNVMINVYLSQSLGISCSDKTLLTPFENIFTYLNITDQTGKESLFQAEMNRCFDYVQKSELNITLDKKIHNIGMIDELFTGTNPNEGMAGSYAILNRLASNPMNLTLVSTHYHEMVNTLNANNFMFYKFTLNVHTYNNKTYFSSNYILEPGINRQFIALDLLKEKGFDKYIIDDAFKYLHSHSTNNALDNKIHNTALNNKIH